MPYIPFYKNLVKIDLEKSRRLFSFMLTEFTVDGFLLATIGFDNVSKQKYALCWLLHSAVLNFKKNFLERTAKLRAPL